MFLSPSISLPPSLLSPLSDINNIIKRANSSAVEALTSSRFSSLITAAAITWCHVKPRGTTPVRDLIYPSPLTTHDRMRRR